ncbi:MAG: hypothetical protein HGA25_10450 [Clostridiales bacterium]|nr:hypothetical protein [Clostridiales bacterium]
MKKQLILCTVLITVMLAYQASASTGCGKWVIRENTDYLEDPLFEDMVKSSTGSNATTNVDDPNKQSEEKEKALDIEPQGIVKNAPVIDLAGKWKVILDKDLLESKTDSTIDLILIQSGERLQGYGTLVEKGSDIPATATGSISEDGISLDVKLTKQNKDYRLDLAQINSTLEGSYELYEEENLAEKGNVTAKRSS